MDLTSCEKFSPKDNRLASNHLQIRLSLRTGIDSIVASPLAVPAGTNSTVDSLVSHSPHRRSLNRLWPVGHAHWPCPAAPQAAPLSVIALIETVTSGRNMIYITHVHMCMCIHKRCHCNLFLSFCSLVVVLYGHPGKSIHEALGTTIPTERYPARVLCMYNAGPQHTDMHVCVCTYTLDAAGYKRHES